MGYDDNTIPKEHYVVLRLAEQYLTRAEARAHLNNIPGAIDDLNLVRARAGLTGTDGNDQSSLVTDIFNERRLELFCEWGHRWFDMKRLGLADNILSPIKSDWQPTDTLYPIPFAELQSNPFLKQNAGY